MRTQSRIAALSMMMVPSLLSAQMGAASRMSYGVLIEANMASISDADEAIPAVVTGAFDKKRRVGMGAGIFVNIPLAGMVSLQPEAHYAQKGVKVESSTATSTASVKLDYVEVPVLLRFDLSKGSSIHPIVMAGASGAFRVSCNLEVPNGSTSVKRKCDAGSGTGSTSTDPFEKFDMSAVGGAGLALNAMGRAYTLQLRYTQGLSNISTDKTAEVKPKNTSISILLGMGF